MIRIDMNAKKIRSGKILVEGSVECKGQFNILEAEIYAVLKTFEENTTEAFINALDRLVTDRLEGDDEE